MLYWMITYPILIPILCFFCGISTDDDTYMVIHHFPGTFMYLNLWILIDSVLIRRKSFQGLNGLFIFGVLLCCFYIIQCIELSIDNFQYPYLRIKNVGVFILSFVVLAINEGIRPNNNELKKILVALIIIEAFGVLLNLMGLHFYRASFDTVRLAFEANYSGTFQSGQALGDFIAVLFLLLCYYFFYKKEIKSYFFFFLSLLSFFCLVSAGSRMCFAIALIGLFLTVFLYQKKHRLMLIGILAAGIIGLQFLSNYSGGDISSNEGLNRIVEGLSSFTQAKQSGDNDNSTMRLSEIVLEDYLDKTPLIGLGLSSQGDDLDVISGNASTVKNLMADAHLAFLIIDIGALGVVLYLLFFYQMFRYWGKHIPKEGVRTLVISYVFLLIFSITEEGFWDPKCFPIFLVFYFAIMTKTGTNKKSNNMFLVNREV